MDIYDFIEYFREKYDLRKDIIYNDDTDIICNAIHNSSTIITIENWKSITIEDANIYCETIRKYIDSHSTVNIFDLYKNNCSIQDYYEYLTYTKFLKNSSIFYNNELKYVSKDAPTGVSQDVYEEAITKYLLNNNFNFTENEIKTRVFGYTNKFPIEYEEICVLTNMKYIGTKYGLSSIAYRDKMSYSSNFKHYDIFMTSSKLCRLIKNKLPDIESDIKQVWICKNDSNILLINMPGYNFITTVDMLINDLNITKTEFEQVIH